MKNERISVFRLCLFVRRFKLSNVNAKMYDLEMSRFHVSWIEIQSSKAMKMRIRIEGMFQVIPLRYYYNRYIFYHPNVNLLKTSADLISELNLSKWVTSDKLK